MQKNLIILGFLVIFCISMINTQGSKSSSTFDQYKKKFGKTYANAEENSNRKINFEKNLAQLNNNPCAPCGVTILFDKSEKQLAQMRGLVNNKIPAYPNAVDVTQKIQAQQKSVVRNLQTSTVILNWNDTLKVSPVKNQANCGSCWAFAAVAFFESHLLVSGRVSTATPPNLAEQFVLKCDLKSGGCNGGNCVSATNLVISKGLPLETKFPYNPYKSYAKICSATPAYKFTGSILKYYYASTEMTDASIIAWLNVRPLMIYVTASTWSPYSPNANGRTFSCLNSDSISTSTLNHAVLLVGYTDTEWIIKNSWGASWGSYGYIYVTRDTNYDCGIGFFVGTLQ